MVVTASLANDLPLEPTIAAAEKLIDEGEEDMGQSDLRKLFAIQDGYTDLTSLITYPAQNPGKAEEKSEEAPIEEAAPAEESAPAEEKQTDAAPAADEAKTEETTDVSALTEEKDTDISEIVQEETSSVEELQKEADQMATLDTEKATEDKAEDAKEVAADTAEADKESDEKTEAKEGDDDVVSTALFDLTEAEVEKLDALEKEVEEELAKEEAERIREAEELAALEAEIAAEMAAQTTDITDLKIACKGTCEAYIAEIAELKTQLEEAKEITD